MSTQRPGSAPPDERQPRTRTREHHRRRARPHHTGRCDRVRHATVHAITPSRNSVSRASRGRRAPAGPRQADGAAEDRSRATRARSDGAVPSSARVAAVAEARPAAAVTVRARVASRREAGACAAPRRRPATSSTCRAGAGRSRHEARSAASAHAASRDSRVFRGRARGTRHSSRARARCRADTLVSRLTSSAPVSIDCAAFFHAIELDRVAAAVGAHRPRPRRRRPSARWSPRRRPCVAPRAAAAGHSLRALG